jgi:inosine-uridine nucleoside N-ribohydrolase
VTPWEPTEDIRLRNENMENLEKKLEQSTNKYNKQTHRICKLVIDKFTKKRNGLNICDLYCAMTAFDNNCVTKFSLCKLDTMFDSNANYGMVYIKARTYHFDEYFYFKDNEG